MRKVVCDFNSRGGSAEWKSASWKSASDTAAAAEEAIAEVLPLKAAEDVLRENESCAAENGAPQWTVFLDHEAPRQLSDRRWESSMEDGFTTCLPDDPLTKRSRHRGSTNRGHRSADFPSSRDTTKARASTTTRLASGTSNWQQLSIAGKRHRSCDGDSQRAHKEREFAMTEHRLDCVDAVGFVAAPNPSMQHRQQLQHQQQQGQQWQPKSACADTLVYTDRVSLESYGIASEQKASENHAQHLTENWKPAWKHVVSGSMTQPQGGASVRQEWLPRPDRQTPTDSADRDTNFSSAADSHKNTSARWSYGVTTTAVSNGEGCMSEQTTHQPQLQPGTPWMAFIEEGVTPTVHWKGTVAESANPQNRSHTEEPSCSSGKM